MRPEENGGPAVASSGSGETRDVPWSDTAEVSVLGAMLIDPEGLKRAKDLLGASDFYKSANRRLFEAMCRLHDRGAAVDVTMLSEELRSEGDLEAVGGMPYIAQLIDAVPGAAGLESWANTVRENAALRDLVQAANSIIEDAYRASPGDGEAVIDQAEKQVLEVSRKMARGDAYGTAGDRVMDVLRGIQEARESKERVAGLETGFRILDRLTSGLHAGDLVLLAARPGMGKTSLALDIVRHVALDGAGTVGIVALEGTEEGLVRRLLCADASVPVKRARAGDVDEDEEEALVHAAGRVRQSSIPIEDTSALTTSEIRTRGRRMVEVDGAELLVVDYLQRARAPGAESRVQEVSRISRSLADLAEELEVPILALSQLSRAPENRGNHRPVLSDLRDTGELEQDADLVAFLYRPAYYADPSDEGYDPTEAELIVAKHRDGPTDTVPLHFHEEIPSFRDVGRP